MVKSGASGAKLEQYRRARERLIETPENEGLLDQVERMLNTTRDMSAGLNASLERQYRRLRGGR